METTHPKYRKSPGRKVKDEQCRDVIGLTDLRLRFNGQTGHSAAGVHGSDTTFEFDVTVDNESPRELRLAPTNRMDVLIWLAENVFEISYEELAEHLAEVE